MPKPSMTLSSTALLYLLIYQAFDDIDHMLLLTTLTNVGVGAEDRNIISDRTQCVYAEGCRSKVHFCHQFYSQF